MLLVISPAKNLDYDTPTPIKKSTKAMFLDNAQALVDVLQPMAPHKLSSLMGISDKLGVLNHDRYQEWQLPFSKPKTRQAVLAFKGEVYLGLDAYTLSDEDFAFAQEHLRILSGLYGVLRPLDSIMPYRLEMGTKLKTSYGKDLYQFWGDTITVHLNKQLKKLKTDTLVNLASQEYFKSVDKAELNAKVVTPVFKEWKNGQYKVLSFFAKKARGQMSAYIIKNKLQQAEQIKAFDTDGYTFNAALSSENEWVFTRKS